MIAFANVTAAVAAAAAVVDSVDSVDSVDVSTPLGRAGMEKGPHRTSRRSKWP